MGIFDKFFISKKSKQTIDIDIKKSNTEPLNAINDEYIYLFEKNDFKYLILSKLGFQIEKFSDFEKVPKEFLNRCLNDEYLNILLENSYRISNELLKKIVDNTISLDDLHSDELFLINILPQSPRVATLVNRNLTEIDTQSKYVVIEGNDNLSSNVHENLIYINSYIEDIKIVMESQKYAKCISAFDDSDIKIFNKSNGRVCENGYLLNNGDVLNSDSIIVLSFEKYKELSRNSKNLEILNDHKFFIADRYEEMKIIFRINKEYSFHYSIDYTNVDLIKYNHIIKIIIESSLSKSEKEYYLYKISNNNIFNINSIIKEIISKIDYNEISNITNKFNMLSYEEKTSKLETIKYSMEIFNYLYPNFFELDINGQINILFSLDESELRIVLEDSRISNLFEEKINNHSDLYRLRDLLERVRGVSQNKCIKDFIEKQGLNIKTLLQTKEYDLKSEFDINPILANYHIVDETVEKEISIEDIIGFDKWHIIGKTSNIVDNLSSFFDAEGDGYHMRGISMLDFKNGSEAIEKLFSSFNSEPLKLSEYDGKYIVSINGLHRTILLRFFYIKELLEGKISNEELRKKYTIPSCGIIKTNYEKTYLHYMLKLLNSSVRNVYNGRKNSSSLIVCFYKDEEKEMSLEEIKVLISNLLSNIDIYSLTEIKEKYNLHESFKSFIDNNFLEFINNLNESEEINNGKSI